MDPFYETMDETAANHVLRHSEKAPVLVERLGTTIFWALVVGIMIARVALFHPALFSATP